MEDGSTAAGAAAVGLTGAVDKSKALVLWGRNSAAVFTGASRRRVPPLQLLLLNMTQEQLRTYNVPLAFVDAYPDRPLIVRATDPVAAVQSLTPQHARQLVALQLLDISADLEQLDGWNPGLPIEVVLADPEAETMKLYRLCRLQRSHPVRVVVPIVPGFSKAVRVASFLQLPVKLEGAQPDSDLIEEL